MCRYYSVWINTKINMTTSSMETKIPTPDPKPKNPLNSQEQFETVIPFWADNPNILLDPKYVFEFYPTDKMTYNQKINAITRCDILLTFISLWFTDNRLRLLIICMLTLFIIYIVHQYFNQKQAQTEGLELQRSSPALDYLQENGMEVSPTVFQEPTTSNPFSNVMMSDYDYNPNKLPAPPASNPVVQDMITMNAKRLVQEANPGQPNINEKLFRDVNDQIDFDHSMRQFHTNPSTTIPNDQGAFAEFCYGSMISCKEGNLFACARNTSHYTLT